VEQLEPQDLGLQVQQDSQVLLGQAVAQQELRELQGKDQRGLQDYLVLTELQELQDCAELQVALGQQVSKAQLDCKVLLASAHLVLQVLQGSKV
jgi:hypothetical protein